MKYRVDLYFSGTITQFIEANSRQSACKKAEQNIENMSDEEFIKELNIHPDGHDIYKEGEY